MTPPAALTWMCLLPSDASYVCQAVPSELRESLDAYNRGKPNQVLVAWDQPAAELPALDRFQGLVAVNCRGLSTEGLQKAGFPHVRRLAVLPSLARPRWFLPLDSPSISASAFALYKPVRPAARVGHFGARLAARSGLHFWYRDEICIAQREPVPLERALQDRLAGCPVRLAISSGNVETVRNRKLSLVVLDGRGRMLGFGKLAGSPLSQRRVRHEARVLAALPTSKNHVRAPQVLFADDVDENYLLVTSPLRGRVPGPHLTSAHRSFLDVLQEPVRKPAAAISLVRALRARLAALPSDPVNLRNVLDQLWPALERLVLPVTIVHRDFTPWNLRRHRGAITAFDWEYAELEGLPLLDEVHHLLAVGYFLKRWTADDACDRLAGMAARAPLGLAPEQVRALQRVYLLDHLTGLLEEGYAVEYPKFVWWRRVLECLAAGTRSSGGAR